jgi:hypothetical protein
MVININDFCIHLASFLIYNNTNIGMEKEITIKFG